MSVKFRALPDSNRPRTRFCALNPCPQRANLKLSCAYFRRQTSRTRTIRPVIRSVTRIFSSLQIAFEGYQGLVGCDRQRPRTRTIRGREGEYERRLHASRTTGLVPPRRCSCASWRCWTRLVDRWRRKPAFLPIVPIIVLVLELVLVLEFSSAVWFYRWHFAQITNSF